MTTFHRFEESFPDEAEAHGLIEMAVSPFDHRLSEDEYASTSFLSFRDAQKKGFEQEYLRIELRFLNLLNTLSEGGVSLIRFPDQLHPINPASSRWRSVVKRGLRYEKFSDELYFHKQDVRFIFNWDLTHWFFFRRKENASAVTELVKAAGLHVLELARL